MEWYCSEVWSTMPEPQPETSSMQPNTNFTQQAPTQPQNNGFTTQVHVNSQAKSYIWWTGIT